VGKKIIRITEPPLKPKQCPYCNNNSGAEFEELHEYVNAITIKIQDDVPNAPLDGMSVIVFEKYTEEIHVGEKVKIIGTVEKLQDKRSKKYHSILLAEEIEYERRRKLVLTDNDILGIKRFVGKIPLHQGNKLHLQKHTDRLVKMLAPNIIANDDKKLALILSMIGAPENTIRGRIHILLIGPPGLAKTQLSREVVKVRPNSRYVSAKNSSGLSLTAMITKEDDNYVLNLGPVPLAKNELCVVNEFDKMYPEQQNNLLDVMEEGEIIVNKFAKLHTIESPTTIIATANPKNNRWKDPGKISIDEIPFESIILNRFDLVLVFRDITDEQASREFAYSKTSYDEKYIQHNYNFLEKFIEYARTIQPSIIEEAKAILNEYWISLKKKGNYLVTNRTLESINRVAKAFARLYLSDIVDTRIAIETVNFMDKLFNEFYGCIHYIPEPRLLAYNETIKVIQQQNSAIDLIEAVKMACGRNEQVKYYIGSSFKQNQNKKIRELCTKVMENPNIQKVQSNPIVVRFKDELDASDSMQSDLSDPRDQHFETQQTENEHRTSSTEEEERNVENNRGSHVADSHATEERRTANVSKKPAIETSVVENSRSQGSQGSRTISIANVAVDIQASPLVHLRDPMIREIPNSAHGPSPSIVTSTYQPKPKIRYTDDGRYNGVFLENI
jgi:replicative DNA helicase Mcm